MRKKSIKQIMEQLDRIIEFARSRNKGLEVINKAFDYTDNIEQHFGLMCFSKSLVVEYWFEEAFKPIPFEIYAKHN